MFPFSMHNDNNTTMFSFGSQNSPFDEVVEKATAETLLEENWGLMMDISDKVSMEGQKACKQVILSIKKRLNNRDPHVVIYALSLLDCLWKNAGTEFRRSVSSKDFLSELRDKSISSVNAVAIKTCTILKEWSENECVKDPSLALISSLYKELNDQGLFFENNEPKKTKQTFSTDPNVVSSSEEEAQLALAIAASLNDASIKKTPTTTNQYPSLSQPTSQSYNNPPPPSYREVKALYDFEAAEDNELTMRSGDAIMVLEDSDANWWKGQSHRGVGLFPSSFVTGDLTENNTNNYTNGTVVTPTEEPPIQIDEEALLKCIQLLEECDPTGETPDPPALAYFENMALQMAPLIDRKLANIDRQHNMLANVDIAMRDVLASYDQAVQQVQIPQMPQMYNNFSQQQGYGIPGVAAPPFPTQMNQPGQFFSQHPGQQMGNQGFPNTSQGIPQQIYNSQNYSNSGSTTPAFPQQQMNQYGQPQLYGQQNQNFSNESRQQYQQPFGAAQFVQSPQKVETPKPETPQQQINQHGQFSSQSLGHQMGNQSFPNVSQGVPQQMYNSQNYNNSGSTTPAFPQQQMNQYGQPQILPNTSQQQSQQPIAPAHFVHPQQQTPSIEASSASDVELPRPGHQILNQVVDVQSNSTQPIAHSSPIPPQQSQQPIGAAHLVRPQQHSMVSEPKNVQENESQRQEQHSSLSNQTSDTQNTFTPIQQQQPIAATQFVHPQQQIITNQVQPNQETDTPKPENQLLNQVADNQGNSTQLVAHSSPIPQQQSQQPIAAAHLVRPQQQNILNEPENVQENETPVVNEETFVTI